MTSCAKNKTTMTLVKCAISYSDHCLPAMCHVAGLTSKTATFPKHKIFIPLTQKAKYSELLSLAYYTRPAYTLKAEAQTHIHTAFSVPPGTYTVAKPRSLFSSLPRITTQRHTTVYRSLFQSKHF